MKWCAGLCIRLLVLFSVLLIVACGGRGYHRAYAPVTDMDTIEKIPRKGVHTVRAGETLFAIAWRYGMDYRTLAAMNHIPPPWRVWVGEKIALRPQRNIHKPFYQVAQKKRIVYSKIPAQPRFVFKNDRWIWPARGHLVGTYSSYNRGINIAGRLGAPVVATAPGMVVYAGDGLRGYGNLIIIKHNNAWLSAYAWNKTNLVHEGEWIKAGQKIATIGVIRNQRPMLHFEIRYNGKSENPLRHLRGV